MGVCDRNTYFYDDVAFWNLYNMTKVKVSELIGKPLDWAVGIVEGYRVETWHSKGVANMSSGLPRAVPWSPSTDWSEGGPIIEREIFKLFRNVGGTFTAQIKKRVPYYSPTYDADIGTDKVISCAGPTPLIAAMRCYCCAKLGDEIEPPQELQLCRQPNL